MTFFEKAERLEKINSIKIDDDDESERSINIDDDYDESEYPINIDYHMNHEIVTNVKIKIWLESDSDNEINPEREDEEENNFNP